MAMKKKAPAKAAPKKKGDEPVRAGKRQQRATEMDFEKTYKKKQSTGGDQPVRKGVRPQKRTEMDTGKKKNSTGGDQSVRVGKRRQTASEMDFQTAWEKAAQ